MGLHEHVKMRKERKRNKNEIYGQRRCAVCSTLMVIHVKGDITYISVEEVDYFVLLFVLLVADARRLGSG